MQSPPAARAWTRGEQLATRPGRAGPVAKIDQRVGELLDPEPLGEGCGQQQPGAGDGSLAIERNVDVVENDVRGSVR